MFSVSLTLEFEKNMASLAERKTTKREKWGGDMHGTGKLLF